jgi:hypothetical protein
MSSSELTHEEPRGYKSVSSTANHDLVAKGGVGEGDTYDLDNLCCSGCLVVIGRCYFLHYGWLHSPSVSDSAHRDLVSVH